MSLLTGAGLKSSARRPRSGPATEEVSSVRGGGRTFDLRVETLRRLLTQVPSRLKVTSYRSSSASSNATWLGCRSIAFEMKTGVFFFGATSAKNCESTSASLTDGSKNLMAEDTRGAMLGIGVACGELPSSEPSDLTASRELPPVAAPGLLLFRTGLLLARSGLLLFRVRDCCTEEPSLPREDSICKRLPTGICAMERPRR
mmetsp:Transcript_8571/g.24447  ORF Transcript_8571/g.24447 Transcript_8571/m.24447 type:complete len:201 (-) Transcript_8571:777-1379(-)